MLDHGSPGPSPAYEAYDRVPSFPVFARVAAPLRVGLLNNMPDAALAQAEQQFRRLAGPGVELRLFAFRGPGRNAAAEAYLDAHYAPHEALAHAGLDALIVTGCEPKAARLDAEPFYPRLSAVVDWAAGHTVSTLFSCLASHAAVLHRDGIERRPLPAKHSGVFDCAATRSHALLAGMPAVVPVPHSRWNDLPEADLAARGYRILRRSEAVGVDLFVREGRSLLVFLQSHPEYDPDSLIREYRRDMGRFLDGTGAVCPAIPVNYLTAESAARLEYFAARARACRASALAEGLPGPAAMTLLPASWQPAASRLFRNWIACVAERRGAPARTGAA